ncbi:MAG: tetratricopeptide repeat protein [Bacteroidetes bacterium]|nr:tetratricopeptide repeat protein [Bacteroidota bacterium]
MNYKNKPKDQSDANVNEWNEAYHPNLKPMYGKAPRTKEQISADKEYVDAMLKIHGDKYKAAKNAARDGWYYFFHETMDTAMFRFNQCWLIDSTYAESYFGFAAIREYQGLRNDAETFYQMAYKTDKSDTLSKHCLYTIANIKEKQKDTLGLIKAFQRAYNKFPNDGIATGKLGFFYSAINKPDSALKYYNITVDLDPEYEQTYINRGWYYFQNKKLKEALKDFTTAIEKNNKSISAYANRALVLMEDKQYPAAISDIRQCIIFDPKYPNFHSGLAECYFQLNQKDKGCEELNIGIQKGGQFSELQRQHHCK